MKIDKINIVFENLIDEVNYMIRLSHIMKKH